ncbi:ImmA/IrrE family metallo-endopeptidase [Viridibacillus soli]|uniref:ImmA/IrrE family metallo-endopeptidase n=1 Tax=Viridibacillus soli TaxID=2798301 RepID=UPI000CC3D731|nr:ImmA/IrrE family metallo-endopeptidase [Viridibacillus soli]
MNTYSYSHLEDFVKTFYTKLNVQHPIDLNILQIAKELHIQVFYWPNSSQSLFFGQTSYIFLNNQLSPQQHWQDFCHELCHVLLHKGDQMNLAPLFREYQEYKANNFSLHTAIPTFMLQQIKLPNDYYQAIRIIQDTFNVEENFAKKRLESYLTKYLDVSDSLKMSYR